MNILACNVGSTSLKFKIYSMPDEKVLVERKMERVTDYSGGIRDFIGSVPEDISIDAVGFKTVLSKDHYGVHLLDEDVLRGMEEYRVVAPAHNAFYLEAIRAFQKCMPGIPLVGVFETAFHQTMKPEVYTYPVPYEWTEKYGIRRFGYHGASHGYVASVLNEKLGKSYRAVSCHLGGSGSITAIRDGECVDTSFGMGLQCGIPQGNRSGDFDPYLIFYLIRQEGMSVDEIENMLQKQSGLYGISGVSNDMRDIEKAAAEGNRRAALAIDIYCREITGYIGRYAAILGGLDAVAFTGGIGENSADIRNRIMEHFRFLPDLKVFVIPANEELVVARKTYQLISAR